MDTEKEVGAVDALQTNQEIEIEQGLEGELPPETEEQSEEPKAEGEQVKVKKPSGNVRKILRLQKELAEEKAKNAKQVTPPQVSEKRPELNEYADYAAYNDALIDWKVEQREKARIEDAKKAEVVKAQQKAATTWQQKVDELPEEYDDYEEVVDQYKDYPVNTAIRQALAESDVGPKLAYHLAKNPDILEEINNKSPYAAAKEMAKLEAQFSEKPSVKISKSPAPINPVKKSSPTVVDLSNMSTDDYITHRMNRKK